ncbi:CD3337/EF1877 family mobilome membrane protein [Staphylococcus caeli]|uniref:Mating channel protein n=1 Tax=Staphylococcus caeli TaxID=2201815 RepID=A0A1D4QEY9_9STAP|nr:hypothetical protein [Staphylococcus caeli]SCT28392.1 putative mating channel protein [Staphylococcus caeli]SCT33717.1 putative mating channel protein [Staphylococcus caeli]
MKHKGLYLLCFLILPILLFTTVSVYAVSNPLGEPTKSVEAKIEKYEGRDLDRYRPVYDKESDWSPFGDEEIAQQINNVTNFFFSMTKIIVSTTDFAITELYNLDVIDDFADKIGEFVNDMYSKLLDNLAMTLFILLCFNAFVIFSVQGNAREALKRGFLIFCLVGFGVGILGNAGSIIKGTNNIGKDINNIVMNSTTAINDNVDYVNENSGMNKIRNQYFNMTIYRTYLMMNYDTVNEQKIKEKNKKRVGDLLKLEPNKDNEDDIEDIISDEVNDYKNKAMKQSNVIGQLGIAIIGFILTIFVSIVFLAISFAKVIFSTFSLFLFLFLVFSWILSFLPNMEISVFKAFARTLGYIILSACMTFLFIVVSLCVDIADMFIRPDSKDAYFLNALFVVALLFVLYKKRSQIIDFISRGNVSFSPSDIGVAATEKTQQSWNKMRKKQSENKEEKRKRQQDKPTKHPKSGNETNSPSGNGSGDYKREPQNNSSYSKAPPPTKNSYFKRKQQMQQQNSSEGHSLNESSNGRMTQSNGTVDSNQNEANGYQNSKYQKQVQQQEQVREKSDKTSVQRNEQNSSDSMNYQNKDNQVPKEVVRTEQRAESKAKQSAYDKDVNKRQVQNHQNKQNFNEKTHQQPIERKPQRNEQSEKMKRQKDINKHGK